MILFFKLLDEATSQLEQKLEYKILLRLKELTLKNNMTILLVSHHISNISAISNSVDKLSGGTLGKIN